LEKRKEMITKSGRVEEGDIKKSGFIGIWRGEAEIGRGEIIELQQSKVHAKSVEKGNEFGMKIKTPTKIQEGDVLESYEEKIKIKTL
jgi:translation initiation factor IF-2